MSRIASIATANGRKWSFGNRYRKPRVLALACDRGAGFALDCVDFVWSVPSSRRFEESVSGSPGVEVCPQPPRRGACSARETPGFLPLRHGGTWGQLVIRAHARGDPVQMHYRQVGYKRCVLKRRSARHELLFKPVAVALNKEVGSRMANVLITIPVTKVATGKNRRAAQFKAPPDRR